MPSHGRPSSTPPTVCSDPSGAPAQNADVAGEGMPPEWSPLWGVALVLGEIAQRLAQRRVEEHAPVPMSNERTAA